MLSLTFEEVHRDQQREVRVLRSGGLDPYVHLRLHPPPYRVAVGPDHHGSASRTVLRQLRLGQDILVPPRKIVLLRSQHRHLIALITVMSARQRPCHSGLRFSRSARRPSATSSVAPTTLRMVSPNRTDSIQPMSAVRHATSLVARCARGAASVRVRAHARASVCNSSGSTSFHTRPISLARMALIGLPVRSSSMALAQPTRLGSRIAPTMVATPIDTSGKQNMASVLAITKSQNSTPVSP